MLGWGTLHFIGGFFIYTIMTYKFYDDQGNEMEIFNKYHIQKITIDLGRDFINLDFEDIDDLITILQTLKNKQIDYEEGRNI
jgi:hypothetical protein